MKRNNEYQNYEIVDGTFLFKTFSPDTASCIWYRLNVSRCTDNSRWIKYAMQIYAENKIILNLIFVTLKFNSVIDTYNWSNL